MSARFDQINNKISYLYTIPLSDTPDRLLHYVSWYEVLMVESTKVANNDTMLKDLFHSIAERHRYHA